MEQRGSYVPPKYMPLANSDDDIKDDLEKNDANPQQRKQDPVQWSSGICACCDDMQSCCIGFFCPCFLFGKNTEFIGAGSWTGPCVTHFTLWGLFNCLCCLLTDGMLLGLPGIMVSCYACGYRRAIREKFNLQEAPCGDFVTHLCCHQCAICQEYRELRERSNGFSISNLSLPAVTAPQIQTMEPGSASK
ncbi:protein PLANT CADMIUM RESISTANCE 10 [Nymphaea colorata]|nr:protein PLANT CADMIUM RESISTANCE 10 [Nymphaea colorata]